MSETSNQLSAISRKEPFDLQKDLIKRRFAARNVAYWVFGRMPMPASQIVVTENPPTVLNEGKIGTVVLGIIKNVDKSLLSEFNSDFKEVSPSLNNSEGGFGESRRNFLSDSVLKLGELVFRVHFLCTWLRLVELPHSGQEVLFLLLVCLPLHKVTFDFMGVFVGDSPFLPGPSKVGKGETVFHLKAAEGFVAGVQMVLQAFSGQVLQLCCQIYP